MNVFSRRKPDGELNEISWRTMEQQRFKLGGEEYWFVISWGHIVKRRERRVERRVGRKGRKGRREGKRRNKMPSKLYCTYLNLNRQEYFECQTLKDNNYMIYCDVFILCID
jgi:hypothetical protein